MTVTAWWKTPFNSDTTMESTMDQWKFSGNTGDINAFTANSPLIRSFFIIVDVDRPGETTHETTELTDSNDYQIEIKLNDIRVLVLT
jgi:hypothetical protein